MMKLSEKNQKVDHGDCPECGEPLVNIYGVTRCSGSLCDYVEHDVVKVAEQNIEMGERKRMFDIVPRITIPLREKKGHTDSLGTRQTRDLDGGQGTKGE